MQIIDIDNIKKRIEEMKKNPPKQKSKKEIIAELAVDIRALFKLGYSYSEILDEFKTGGLNLQESTLKNYLSKASSSPKLRPGSTEAGTPPPPSPSAQTHDKKKKSKILHPSPSIPVEENNLSTNSNDSPPLPVEENNLSTDSDSSPSLPVEEDTLSTDSDSSSSIPVEEDTLSTDSDSSSSIPVEEKKDSSRWYPIKKVKHSLKMKSLNPLKTQIDHCIFKKYRKG